jgi:hypothetical protein
VSNCTATDFFSEEHYSKLIEIGNYFKTAKLAQIAADKIKEVLKEVKHF